MVTSDFKHYFNSNSSTMATPRVKITERKLHRHKADGLAWVGGGLVELDPRMTERYRLEVLVHELLHHMHPEWVEEEVERHGEWLGKILWRQGYRRVKS
jgi:hypothetical protein